MKKNEMSILKGIRNGLCFLLVTGLVACSGDATTGVEGELAETEEIVAEEEVADTWDEEEFGTTFASTDYYEEWDENDDNMLDKNEYALGFHDVWDVNDDDRLDETEWNNGVGAFGLENETWSEWDTTGDGILDENEFEAGFADATWYGDWDMDDDELLTEDEYGDGLFGLWDDNDDGVLDDAEYGEYNTYFGM